MKNVFFFACLVLQMVALTTALGSATQTTIAVTGGGSLTYTYLTHTASCQGHNGRSTIYHSVITTFSGFSYDSASGVVTNLPGSGTAIQNSGCGTVLPQLEMERVFVR